MAAYVIDARKNSGDEWWHWVPLVLLIPVVVGLVRVLGYGYLGWEATDPEGLLWSREASVADLERRLYGEAEAMASHALANGKAVSSPVMVLLRRLEPSLGKRARGDLSDKVPDAEVEALAAAHAQLAELVAPATPRTLRILAQGSFNRVLPFLGRIRLVRHFLYLAILFLVAFIGLTFKADFSNPTSATSAASNVLFNATGSTKLANAALLVVAAGLGACFYALYRAHTYIAAGNYDPSYEPTYWMRFIIGVVAGFVLAALIPPPTQEDFQLTMPLLAFLGGFAAEVVHRILGRFVEALDALIRGGHRELLDLQSQASAAKATTERLRANSARARSLMELRTALAAQGAVETVLRAVDEQIASLLSVPALSGAGNTVIEAPNGATPGRTGNPHGAPPAGGRADPNAEEGSPPN